MPEHRLILCRATTLTRGADDTLPTRMLVLPWGESEILDGTKVKANAVTLRELPGMQDRNRFDKVALDFNHNTVKGTPFYQGTEPVKVAAYGVPEVVDGEGVYLASLEWTPEGKEAFQGKHYCDLSPTIVTNKSGEVVMLHSAAMCRQGQIKGLTLPCSADMGLIFSEQKTENTMDFKKLTLAILGLAEDATDADITTAAEKFGTKETKEPTALSVLEGRIKVIEEGEGRRERAAICDRAKREGKVIPLSAEDIEKLDVKVLSAMVDKLTATVPLERRTAEVKTLSTDAGLTESDKLVCLTLGVSEEDFKKANPTK